MYLQITTNHSDCYRNNYNLCYFQLRALDWDVAGPLQDAPTVVVYHPDQGHNFINVGWSGWIASISGIVVYNNNHDGDNYVLCLSFYY